MTEQHANYKPIDLTADEIELILNRRAKQSEAKARLARALNALKTAAAFEEWLQKKGRGATFSTFVNEFGFQADGASAVYALVEKIRDLAHRHEA